MDIGGKLVQKIVSGIFGKSFKLVHVWTTCPPGTAARSATPRASLPSMACCRSSTWRCWRPGTRYFSYFGRRDEADRRFANGDCAMLTSTSSILTCLGENKSLDWRRAVALPRRRSGCRRVRWPTAPRCGSAAVSSRQNPKRSPASSISSWVRKRRSTDAFAGGYLPMTPVV